MLIKDTTGRTMMVDLVYNDPQRGWLKAPVQHVKGSCTAFCRVPHGRYALRINSLKGAEALVFDNGERLTQTAVPSMTQHIEFDAAGNAFQFVPKGQSRPVVRATDVAIHNDTTSAPDTADGADATGGEPPVKFVPPTPTKGHGLVVAIVRFAKTNDPYGEPPQEEFELAFQMLEPDEYDDWFAKNFHRIVEAPALPNEADPFSREPASDDRLRRLCTFCNHKH